MSGARCGAGGVKPMAGIRSTEAHRRLAAQVRAEESICWLCHQPIDRTLPHRNPATGRINPRSWSLDHVVPIDSEPQLALVRANCRAAHLGCNSARGKRPPKRPRPTQQLITTRAW